MPSAGSKAGQKFIGPGAGSSGMPNLGEMKVSVVCETGDTGLMTIQVAEVRKPLRAVSALNKKGNPQWFDGENSYIIPGSAANLGQIRTMLKSIKNKIPLHMSNGVFIMKAWKRPSPFQGQGR